MALLDFPFSSIRNEKLKAVIKQFSGSRFFIQMSVGNTPQLVRSR